MFVEADNLWLAILSKVFFYSNWESSKGAFSNPAHAPLPKTLNLIIGKFISYFYIYMEMTSFCNDAIYDEIKNKTIFVYFVLNTDGKGKRFDNQCCENK